MSSRPRGLANAAMREGKTEDCRLRCGSAWDTHKDRLWNGQGQPPPQCDALAAKPDIAAASLRVTAGQRLTSVLTATGRTLERASSIFANQSHAAMRLNFIQ
jgi:hypothetical protein